DGGNGMVDGAGIVSDEAAEPECIGGRAEGADRNPPGDGGIVNDPSVSIHSDQPATDALVAVRQHRPIRPHLTRARSGNGAAVERHPSPPKEANDPRTIAAALES